MDTETVTVVRPPGKDRFGDPQPGSAVEFAVPGCLFAPGPSAEQNTGANQVLTDATIYGPAGMDILATDKVRARGELYEVVGTPQDWGSAGMVIPIKRSTG